MLKQQRTYLNEQDLVWFINILLKCIDKKRISSICDKASPDATQKETSLEDLTLMNDLSQKEFEEFLQAILIDEKSLFHLKVFIKTTIDCLSYKQRQVLYHMFWEKLGVSEIAKKYEVSKNSIYRIKERALKQIVKSVSSGAPRGAHISVV